MNNAGVWIKSSRSLDDDDSASAQQHAKLKHHKKHSGTGSCQIEMSNVVRFVSVKTPHELLLSNASLDVLPPLGGL